MSVNHLRGGMSNTGYWKENARLSARESPDMSAHLHHLKRGHERSGSNAISYDKILHPKHDESHMSWNATLETLNTTEIHLSQSSFVKIRNQSSYRKLANQ